MTLKSMSPKDHTAILEIAKSLPQWFTSGGIESITKDIQFQDGIVAFEDNQAIGFLTFFVNQGVANIGWMGVLPACHRRGVGEKLLQELRIILLKHQITSILVGTLGDSVDYEPYERTRAFYRKNGFVDFQKVAHPENPEQEEELILRSEI
jgi:GNAT superfamily N-acetyltransferase